MGFPDNPWDDLSPELQDLFWQQTGADYLDPGWQEATAETLFAVGFGFHAEDYDRMGIDPDAVNAAREDYFDLLGLEWDDFDWDAWREEMGYND